MLNDEDYDDHHHHHYDQKKKIFVHNFEVKELTIFF